MSAIHTWIWVESQGRGVLRNVDGFSRVKVGWGASTLSVKKVVFPTFSKNLLKINKKKREYRKIGQST
jgi:hypothetical protein